RARTRGSGWMLSGVAPLVETASRADLFVVSARTGDDRAACFLVERDAHRLGLSEVSETVGGRGLGSCDVIFDGVQASARLEDGAGASGAQLARIGAAAIGVGVAQAAFEAALRYSQQRSTFGQPICHHQAIQLKLADMATWITASRLLTNRAAERFESGGGDLAAALMARIETAETASKVTLEAMRIHGGYGYTREFPVERFYRDAAWLLARPRDLAADRSELARNRL